MATDDREDSSKQAIEQEHTTRGGARDSAKGADPGPQTLDEPPKEEPDQ